MYFRIFALFVFIGVIGSFSEARSSIFGYPFGNGGLEDRSSPTFFVSSRSKRAVDSNGETTTKPTTSQATTTNPTTTDPTTTPSSTTPPTSPTTTPSTEPTTPTTTPTTTTSPTTESPTTTPTTTSVTTPTTTSATTPTSTSETTPTTPSTTTPESTKPTSKPKKPTNDLEPRSNFDESEPEDSSKKPGPPSKGNKNPAPGSGFPGSFGPGFNPYFGYPGFNSIPGSNPNYAWTGTNNGPGFASAGASAGSFAGGYPGTGYPTAGTGSPFVGGRGGFQDNTPKPNGYGYGGVDPLYNAGPGFYYPGQIPGFQDPFDMFRQIQAQIEAQHQAIAKSMASNQGRPFASNIPNYSYSHSVSPNVRYPIFDDSPNIDISNSNMELHNRLANEAANYGGGSFGGGSGYSGEGGYGGSGPQIASASIGLGPRGGFQSGFISPAGPGIESRFAEDLPSPSGNSFGVFASSSSSSRTGPDGKQINQKSSVTGINDNGKISYRTVHD